MKNKLLQSILAAAFAVVIPFSTVNAELPSPIDGLNMIECPAEGEVIYTSDSGKAEITFAGTVPPKQEEVIIGTSIEFNSNNGCIVIKSEIPIENATLIITEYEDDSYENEISSESYNITTVDGIAELEVVEKYLYKNIKATLLETPDSTDVLCEMSDYIAMTGLLEPELEILIGEPMGTKGSYKIVDWATPEINEHNTFSYTVSLKPGAYNVKIRGERVSHSYEVNFTVSDAEFELGGVLIGTIPGLSGEDVQTYIDADVLDGISYSSVDVLMNIDNDETGAILYVHLTEESRDSVLEAIDVLLSNSGVKYAEPNYIAYPDDPVVTELTMTECPEEGEVIPVGDNGKAEITFAGIVPPIQKEVIVGTSMDYSGDTVTVKSETPLENCTLAVIHYEDDTYSRPLGVDTYSVTTENGIAEIEVTRETSYTRAVLWNNLEEMIPLCDDITFYVHGTGAKLHDLDIKVSVATEGSESLYDLIKWSGIKINEDNTFSTTVSLEPGEYRVKIGGLRAGTAHTVNFTVQ